MENKTAEQVFIKVREQLDKGGFLRLPQEEGDTEGTYDGSFMVVVQAMKEYCEQERKKAFEAGCNNLTSPDGGWEYETFEDYSKQNPLT